MEEAIPTSSSSCPSSPTLKQKLKHKYASFFSPFRKAIPHATLPSSRIKRKCKSFIYRIGRNSGGQGQGQDYTRFGHHRRSHSHSGDFHYDAMSYALNFDEGNDDISENDFPLSFSSRLPPAPPKTEIECV
ncbi:hypothetical protein JCGZ_16960 [Jatropha curcas]|uniref:Uncharacterized protein n=1 Tax=Jatropha curcas TaxID=180498 RepID=A0A067K573_JATCU|nr:uncharacterized protein LOC105641316 [Jatropha curcas]KDP30178.1 hypothetical protein JCGZ_16960 [Jatropha curcas]